MAAANRRAYEVHEALGWIGYSLMASLRGPDGEEFSPGVLPEALGFISRKV